MLKAYLGFPRAVYVLCLGTFINRAGTLLMPFLTLYLGSELGLGIGFATLAMGVYGAAAIVGALVGGHLADRIGRRAVMLISLLGGAAVLRFFGDFAQPAAILGALAVFSVLAEMYRPAAAAMIADLVEPGRRPHAYGLMYVAINLGFAVGAALGGFLAALWFVWLFWLDALTAAAYAAIILLLIAETRPSAKPAPCDPPSGVEAPPRFEALRHILRDRVFIVFCAGSLLCGLVFMQFMSTFPLHLHNQGITTETYGLLISVNGAMIVVCQLPVAALISRFHRGTVVTLAAALLGVGFGATALAAVVWQFVVVVVICTCAEMMQAPLMSSIVTDLAPERFRARYLGVLSMCFSSANMIGAPMGGAVLVRFDSGYLWGGCLAGGLMAALLYWSIRRRLAPPAS